MEELMDLMVTGESSSEVSDKIKEILYAKAAERIDIARPYVANAMFGQELEIPEVEDQTEVDDESTEEEPTAELETETETDTEEESQ